MKKLVLASFLTVSVASVAAFADSFSGYISDAHCGVKHNTVSAANTKCVADMCIKGGAAPVLVSDGKVIKFDAGSADKAKAFAGQNVKIDGTLDGDALKITSIDKAE
ncbi:MAG TPA: hypothetical protein VK604_04380 [Bryobacteraceae bacterium]|nr:hypothetical protein [Bryobacteraceae bacterium]